MCHHIHVRLTVEERQDARKLAWITIPIYASVVLAVIAVVTVTSAQRQNELLAQASVPAEQR